jgi:NAD(P) transhydrogenase subunit alpha
MKIGVPKEASPGERRVALVPETVSRLAKAGHEVLIERDAGVDAGYPDATYEAVGGRITSGADVLGADVVACVRALPASAVASLADGSVVLGMLRPLSAPVEM